jgi:hypothetical protein
VNELQEAAVDSLGFEELDARIAEMSRRRGATVIGSVLSIPAIKRALWQNRINLVRNDGVSIWWNRERSHSAIKRGRVKLAILRAYLKSLMRRDHASAA